MRDRLPFNEIIGSVDCIHILQEDTEYVIDHWLSHLQAMMLSNRLKVHYDSWTILPLRQHDQYLMNDFVDQDFPTHKLVKLNACCMYLQVTTLAEITDYMGAELLPQLLIDHASSCPKGLLNISFSTLQWPHVAVPSPTCWHLWTSTICMLYTGLHTGTHLQHPLGKWTIHYDKHQFWNW